MLLRSRLWDFSLPCSVSAFSICGPFPKHILYTGHWSPGLGAGPRGRHWILGVSGLPFPVSSESLAPGGGVKEDPGLRPGAYSAIWADLQPEATN